MKKLALLSIITLCLLGAAALAIGATTANASNGGTVRTAGSESLKVNLKVSSDFRYSPNSPVVVKSGDSVTFTETTGDMHTVTLGTPDQLVKTIEDLFGPGCPACQQAAQAALGGHFATNPPTVFYDPDANGQFDNPGDSLLLFPNSTLTEQINVPAGTTLYFFCSFHPWMQGTIVVK